MASRAAARPRPKAGARPKTLTKNQFITEVANHAGVDKKQALAVIDAIEAVTADEIRKKGVAAPLPGLIKVTVVHRKATPARQGRNPRTGEPVAISAKPARKMVRARALKRLKEMV